MTKEQEFLEVVKDYIKNNLRVVVEEETSRSCSHSSSSTYVRLLLDGKVISESQIDKLNTEQ